MEMFKKILSSLLFATFILGVAPVIAAKKSRGGCGHQKGCKNKNMTAEQRAARKARHEAKNKITAPAA